LIVLGKPIVHFEIPVTDSEKMSQFYGDLFDWKIDKQDMPGMDYWMIETTGQGMTDLRGGMYPKQGNESPRFYVGVEDIDQHTERFKQAGGSVLVEKQEVPGFGWAVIGSDPEGNVLGLFQPLQRAPPQSAKSQSSPRRKSSSSSRAKKKPSGSKSSSKKRKK
jgi:uncharacterized protein